VNGNTALDIVMERLVRTDAALRVSLLREMNNLIHNRLEQGMFVPWFLLQNNESLALTPDVETVVLPTGFLRFDDDAEVGGVWVEDTTITTPDQWVQLTRQSYNAMKVKFATYDPATPTRYDVLTAKLYFRPIPDVALNLRVMAYFADADVADAASTTLWLTYAADLIIAETALVGASIYTRDANLVPILAEERKLCLQRLETMHIARQEALQSRVMEG
jgi:predicted nuclease of predicted toxin-antitoxin system